MQTLIPFHLSPRQHQTLNLILAGDSEKQVAYRLGISQHTVHVYVKALYRRFGVNSRGELMAWHLRQLRSMLDSVQKVGIRLAMAASSPSVWLWPSKSKKKRNNARTMLAPVQAGIARFRTIMMPTALGIEGGR